MPRISLGDIYLIPTPPNGSHYYVAIAPSENDSYLFVNYSTVQDSTPDEYLDYTLSPSRTPAKYLDRESYLVFGSAEEFSGAQLDLLNCRRAGVFSPTIVESIQYAGLASKSLKNKYKRLLKSCLGL
jgi:hypothetical protein